MSEKKYEEKLRSMKQVVSKCVGSENCDVTVEENPKDEGVRFRVSVNNEPTDIGILYIKTCLNHFIDEEIFVVRDLEKRRSVI